MIDLGDECLLTELLVTGEFGHSSTEGCLSIYGSRDPFLPNEFAEIRNKQRQRSKLGDDLLSDRPRSLHFKSGSLSLGGERLVLLMSSKIPAKNMSKGPHEISEKVDGWSVRYLYGTFKATSYANGVANFSLHIFGLQIQKVTIFLFSFSFSFFDGSASGARVVNLFIKL